MTDRERPRALLAGATGLVGGHLLREILDRQGPDREPAYASLTVLTRRELPPAMTRGAGIPIRVERVDFARLADAASAIEADHVYCALGTTMRKARSKNRFRTVDFDYPLSLARHTLESGAVHFAFVSSIGASPSARSFYLRVKGETEEAIARVGFPGVTIARPSVIGGARSERRPLEAVGKAMMTLLPGRLRTIRARDIASAMVTLALEERAGVRVVESEALRRVARRGV